MKKISAIMVALAATIAANASIVDFTYNRAGDVASRFGYDKKEVVNVAIRIKEPGLVGCKVTSMSVPVSVNLEATTLGECTAFLTTELKRENKANVANICTEAATLKNGQLSCTFSEPYTITEEGVYVGYTIPVEEVSASVGCKPIAVVAGTDADGLYIYATRSVLNWTSKSVDLGAVSAMSVTLDGEFAADAAGISLNSKYALVGGEKSEIMVKFSNYGTNELKSVEYTYSIGDKSGTAVKELSPAVEASFGSFVNSTISIDVPEQSGTYNLEVTLKKANGVECSANKSTAEVSVAPFVPVNRPLVEEFTGLWCGWCPRGYAAMEQLDIDFPETFVGLAYHNSDPMAVMSSYPVGISGYPSATINRGTVFDPGNLTSSWPKEAAKIANSNVQVELSWANEEKTILRSTTKVRFLENQKGADFRIGACLVADGLEDPSWEQSNYYYNSAPTGVPLLDELFVGQKAAVTGLKFNDVVLSFPNPYGVAQGIPAEIKQYEEVTYVEDFDLNAVRNIEKFFTNPIQNIEKLRVVGVLFDKAGAPVNSGSSAYSTAGGKINFVGVDTPVISDVVVAADGASADVTFTCPTTYDGKQDVLIPNGTKVGSNETTYFHFSIYVNGSSEPYKFTTDNYPGLTRNATDVIFGVTNVENMSFADNKMTVKVFCSEIKNIGVQTNYVYGRTTLNSQIAAFGDETSIREVEAIDADSEISAGKVSFFDLQGRAIGAPRAGQIVIRKSGNNARVVKF
ncbi:MAG: hypothetical protein K2O38_00215 [Muribaculaceae bacterium]|nr:hypothetical protein [Muribaculaceae bacterium]